MKRKLKHDKARSSCVPGWQAACMLFLQHFVGTLD
jgi:hypothetical protein